MEWEALVKAGDFAVQILRKLFAAITAGHTCKPTWGQPFFLRVIVGGLVVAYARPSHMFLSFISKIGFDLLLVVGLRRPSLYVPPQFPHVHGPLSGQIVCRQTVQTDHTCRLTWAA